MPLVQLDSENADRDLTSQVTVLTHTPSASEHRQCQAYVAFGDGAKDLDGTGGDFEVTVTVGGQTIQPDPQTVTFSTAVRAAVWTTPFPVPANAAVVVKVLSPNAADSDVDVTAQLFDVPAGDAIQLGGSTQSATAMALMYNSAVTSGAVSDVGPSSSSFDTGLTEATNDHYNDSAIVFTSGVLKGQVRPISDYVGASKNITVDPAFTEAPGNGDAFLILGRIVEG